MPWLRSLALLVLACAPAAAADWPQWLGPDRDNSSPETVAVWKEAPKVLWRQPVGEGNGSSVVAFDRRKGTVAWKALDDKASYSSPIAFGKGKGRQVVFLTGDGVVSLSPADGSLFWRFPLKDALLESSTTPVRAGDTLVASS